MLVVCCFRCWVFFQSVGLPRSSSSFFFPTGFVGHGFDKTPKPTIDHLFSYERVGRNWDQLSNLFPLLVFEIPVDEGQATPSNSSMGGPMLAKRWKDLSICRVVVLRPAPLQCYCARQLRTVPHYQIATNELPELERRILEHNSRSHQQIKLEVIGGTPNDFILGLGKLPVGLNLMELARPLAGAGLLRHKKGRNQFSVDLGTTGHNNSVRSRVTLGLPRPSKFSGTDTEEARCLFGKLGDCLLKVFPDHHRSLMQHEERNRLFSYTHCPGSPIEAVTLAVNEVSPLTKLSPHVDSNNDNSSEEHSMVNVLSDLFWDPATGKLARVAVVLYWKQSASDFVERSRRLFRPARIVLRYADEVLSRNEREVGPHLLPAPGVDHVSLAETHSCKFVTYTVLAEAIRLACSKCPSLLTGEHLASMIYAAAATNLPRVFGEELLFSVENQDDVFGGCLEALPWQEFGCVLYERVRQVSSTGKEDRGYVAFPRHRPCHTTAPRDVVLSSIGAVHRMMVNLVDASRRDSRDCRLNPSYYYDRAVASLSQPTGSENGGAHGVGPFGAQFLVGVAGLLLPIEGAICACASVGYDTLTGGWLRRLGLRSDHKEFHDDQASLVQMVSSCLDEPQTVAEEMVCKAGKHDRGTCGMFKDLIPGYVGRINYRLADGTLMGVLQDGSCLRQQPLQLGLSLHLARPSYWCVDAVPGRLSARRSRTRAGMVRNIGSQLPLVNCGHGEQVEVLPPEAVVLSSTRELCSPFDAARVARLCGGAHFETVLVDDSGKVLSLEERLKHQERQKKSVPGLGNRKSRSRKKMANRWHCASVMVDGARVSPPPGFALRRDGPGKSLVHQGTRFFKSKDDALEFAVLNACLSMPESFCHLSEAKDLLPSMPCHLSGEDAWDGEENPVVSHRVISRLTTHDRSRRQDNKSKLPYLVTLRFRSGARGAYLVTPDGKPCSDVQLSFACETMRKNFSETVECIGIASHRKQAKGVHVLVVWADSSRSWVPLEEAAVSAPWAVALYSWKNRLTRRRHWRSAKKARSPSCLFPPSAGPHFRDDVSNKTRCQLIKFGQRRELLAAGVDPELVERVIHQRAKP